MSESRGEGDDDQASGGRGGDLSPAAAGAAPWYSRRAEVRFDRAELDLILRLYGRMVGAGEWRDYAIDHLADAAVFSVFRRTSEMPLYRITKQPRLARRQGAYSVVATGGLILKRGHQLEQVLRVLEPRPRLVGA